MSSFSWRACKVAILWAATMGGTLLPSVAFATTFPTDFVETILATNLASPTAMRFAPDKRLFICEQGGALRVVKNGQLLPTPFLRVNTDSNGERGLLGVTFDPNFASTPWVYIYYTVIGTNGARYNRVSRFRASLANPDVAEAGSEQVVLDLPLLSSATNHNGGALAFAASGKLLVAVGENANRAHAQSLNTTLGKMLRINPDGSIPTDNPFYSKTTGQNRAIWALGLRNPFTFAIQPGSNRVFINDVGERTYEEINDGKGGANYGWPNTEGPTNVSGISSPLFSYDRSGGCAITGGTFYNPRVANFPSNFVGKYFYSDFCGGYIRVLDPAARTSTGFATGIASPVGLETGPDGALYYIARGNGGVLGRIAYSRDLRPVLNGPNSVTVRPGENAVFEVQASGTAPFVYKWQRSNDGTTFQNLGVTTPRLTLTNVQLADSGALFRVLVNNSYGTTTSREAKLTVSDNQVPIPQIVFPTTTKTWRGNQLINFSGSATDQEDGELSASAFTWRVDFQHDTHAHPFLPSETGSKTGSFVTANRGETSTNVWYRIILTVKDSTGLQASTFRDIYPIKSNLTLQTNIPGVPITLDSQSVSNPSTTLGVAGMRRTVSVPATFVRNGITYTFQSWSDGGARTHEINFPYSNATLTATYGVSSGAVKPSAGDF